MKTCSRRSTGLEERRKSEPVKQDPQTIIEKPARGGGLYSAKADPCKTFGLLWPMNYLELGFGYKTIRYGALAVAEVFAFACRAFHECFKESDLVGLVVLHFLA